MTRVVPLGDMVAARHALALQDPEASAEAIMAALDWIEQEEGRDRAIASVDRFLAACDEVSSAFEAADPVEYFQEDDAVAAPSMWRRLVPLAACLLFACAIFGGVMIFLRQDAAPTGEPAALYATAIGETRTFDFSDRSRITLAGSSAVTVRLDGATRYITLSRGQALVDGGLASDAVIVIDTGESIVSTRGGEIDVDRSSIGTVVTQVRGQGMIRKAVAKGPVQTLDAGNQVTYFADGRISDILSVDPADITGWKSGKLRFIDKPLDAVVADLNRYSRSPIIIENPVLGQRKVTGLVRVNRIPAWLRGLAMSMEIEVTFVEDGPILLRDKPRPLNLTLNETRRPSIKI